MTKVIFEMDFWSANQVLRSLRLGRDIMGLCNAAFHPLDHLIDDLGIVIDELAERDPLIGDTAGGDREVLVYIQEENDGTN